MSELNFTYYMEQFSRHEADNSFIFLFNNGSKKTDRGELVFSELHLFLRVVAHTSPSIKNNVSNSGNRNVDTDLWVAFRSRHFSSPKWIGAQFKLFLLNVFLIRSNINLTGLKTRVSAEHCAFSCQPRRKRQNVFLQVVSPLPDWNKKRKFELSFSLLFAYVHRECCDAVIICSFARFVTRKHKDF